MQVAATLRYARISPQKCRLVADTIRGKSVDDALRSLTFSPKKSARIVKKVLESAIANAEHNHGADIDELKKYIQQAFALASSRTGSPGGMQIRTSFLSTCAQITSCATTSRRS